MFREESVRIQSILRDELVEIQHIGSTAIPGMSAKPVIDMLPIVKDIMQVDDYNESFIEHRYEPRGEYGLAGRRYFVKGKPESTHYVHIYQEGDPAIIRHIAFRACSTFSSTFVALLFWANRSLRSSLLAWVEKASLDC